MRRFFNIVLGALAMIAVALLSAFVTMRLAIHGREVEVPNVAGLTITEARGVAAKLGLNINIENHFYSTVTPAGRVLSQYPAPGTKVRREWVMRITESIGPQRVAVPNVIGKSEREASVTIRRLSLDLGTVAYIAAPGPAGIVLSQTPTPAAAGVDGPRISLLVSEPVPVARPHQQTPDSGAEGGSDPDSESDHPSSVSSSTPTATQAIATSAPAVSDLASAATNPVSAAAQPEAYVMPNLIGLSLSTAFSRVAAMGLKISSVDSVRTSIPSVPPPASAASSGQNMIRPVTPMAPITLANTVISQRPAAGHRVTKADEIHVTLAR